MNNVFPFREKTVRVARKLELVKKGSIKRRGETASMAWLAFFFLLTFILGFSAGAVCQHLTI
jgi:hypothetical protein